MPDSPIDHGALERGAKALVNRVIPPIDQLERAAGVGYSYLGFGFMRSRNQWIVDRDGETTVGGELDVAADLGDLAAAVMAGGMPPAKIEAAIQAAVKKVTSLQGSGPFEWMVLPIFIPTSQVESVCAMAKVVFEALAGRVEP